MLISLVICTRNRCTSLRSCLEYVQRLESPGEWELVVVDNGSTDGTADLLKDFVEKASFRVVLVYEAKPGLGRARNAGIAKATGEIIAFTDDDCYVSRDFLIRIREVFREQSFGFMGGRILLYDETDAPITIRPQTKIHVIEPKSFILAGEIQGANMAARRSLLEEIGGFDPDLGVGTRFAFEDVDFQARASQSGATGVYHPGPLLWHHHGRKSGKDFIKLKRRYDHARGAYYAKFILKTPTRTLFLKNWYWLMLNDFHGRQFGPIVREIAGAVHYTLIQVWKYLWPSLLAMRRPSYAVQPRRDSCRVIHNGVQVDDGPPGLKPESCERVDSAKNR